MARTTTTPHKVSRNKSGTPIVRASKLFPGRPKRTTRETAFETEQQARIFVDALNLAAVRDGDWRWLKGETWTAQRRYVDAVLRLAQEQVERQAVDGNRSEDAIVSTEIPVRGCVVATCDMSMVEAVEEFRSVYIARPNNEAGQNYASWLGAVGMAFGEYSLAHLGVRFLGATRLPSSW